MKYRVFVGGLMGVSLSYLDNPSPFYKVVGMTANPCCYPFPKIIGEEFIKDYFNQGNKGHYTDGMYSVTLYKNGLAKIPFARLLIRRCSVAPVYYF